EYARSQTRRSWDLRRELSKLNYQLHTDSIKEHIIPRIQHFQIQIPDWSIYAAEADLINLAAFGMTAKQWRETNPDLATRGNIRDFADHDQLHVLLNLESLNSALIEQGLDKDRRFSILSQHSLSQYRRLAENNNLKRLE
ncbi:MAG: KilA-N domain-containing protein, partial [Bacteroidota bacterium]